jgi:hypothetical protein
MASQLRDLIQLAGKFEFPTPWYFDIIGVQDEAEGFKGLVFHYKSGSNYQPWATADYNRRKSKSLASLLDSNHEMPGSRA